MLIRTGPKKPSVFGELSKPLIAQYKEAYMAELVKKLKSIGLDVRSALIVPMGVEFKDDALVPTHWASTDLGNIQIKVVNSRGEERTIVPIGAGNSLEVFGTQMDTRARTVAGLEKAVEDPDESPEYY